jgi:hypothetical protein
MNTTSDVRTLASRSDRLIDIRAIGKWSAFATLVLELLYVPVLVVGFIAQGNFSDPLGDPYLAILEVLILMMAPAMVIMMAAVHAVAAPEDKVFSLTAFAFMVLAAGLTASVHFVLLTVDRQIDPNELPGYDVIFSWEWPSVFYALDIVAWDLFLGLALLFAAPVFRGRGRLEGNIRRFLAIGGTMCLAGLIGPAVGNIDLRLIGEFGYWFVFPAVALMLGLYFSRMEPKRE